MASIDSQSKSGRSVAIDVLRGYCILMMIAGHIGAGTTVFESVHLLRHISGAEGFVFLSGLVLGMVYRKKLAAASAMSVYPALLRRAGLIWVVHCTLVIAAVLVNPLYFQYAAVPDVSSFGAAGFLWMTATLQYQPAYHLNILPLYVVLLLATPLALEALRRGRVGWLLAASIALFWLRQVNLGAGQWVHPICGPEEFPLLTWQVLFVLGLAVGYHKAQIRAAFVEPRRALLTWWLVAVCAIVTVIVTYNYRGFTFYSHTAYEDFLFAKNPLRWGRLGFFLLSISALYLAASAALLHGGPALRRALSSLALLGRNSLYAFIVHVCLVFALGVYAAQPHSRSVAELLPLGVMGLVYVMARFQVGRRWIPN